MESDSSQLFPEVKKEQVPAPATERNEDQPRERVLDSDLMVKEGDLVGIDQILDQTHEIASSALQFTLRWEEIDKHYTTLEDLLKGRTMEVELKEISVMERVLELEKKEERLKEVEERERKIGLHEKSMILRLEEKEKENDVKQYLVSSLMRLVCEKANEEAVNELEERGKEVERISKCNDDKSSELDKAVEEFGLKQKELIEIRNKEAELVKESLKQLQAREKEFSVLDEAIKEKVTELEKKNEFFETKLKAKAEEMDLKSKEKLAELEQKEKVFEVEQKAKAKQMDVKEKKLDEREKELELKQRELEVMDNLKERELQVRAETCKRPRVQFLAENGSEADSLIRPAKRRKSHSHDNADKETNSAYVVSASVSSPEHMNKADKEEFDEEPEQIKIVDSEFHDFKKTMSSFVVDKMWALYDPKDCMPRLYAKIKRVNKSRLSLDVTWVEPKDDISVPVACGRFTYGRSGTVSHLAFSHELQPIIHGRNFIAVNPKEGETWALFRDWSESWDNNPVQHEPPYGYDLVEVVLGFKDHPGVGVSYLGKVKGFVSVFKRAAQHGVFQLVISPKEMHRFSHRVPSIRLNGEEKEGVPAGSYELDPAAVPSYILHGKTEADEVEVQDSSGEDIPIIID